jgi:MFS transporter, ACS family, hexuronate transporter
VWRRLEGLNSHLDTSAFTNRHRWRICLLLLVSTLISYIDRQAFSIAAPVLSSEFHFSNSQIAVLVNSFLICYAVGQLVAGRFLDRVGARIAFSTLTVAWSAAAALMGVGSSMQAFVLSRAALGLAEGVNFPGAVKVVAEWFAPRERATAVGVFTSGASLGAVIAPPLFAVVIVACGWRTAFFLLALPGLAWVLAWLRLYQPRPTLGVAALTFGAAGQPPGTLLRERRVWGVALARFLEEPASWFYLTWLPICMRTYRHVPLVDTGMALVFPFVALDIGYLAGGWTSSRLIGGGWSIDTARKTVMVVGALCMLSGILAAGAVSNFVFVAWVSLAMLGHGAWGSNMFTLPSDMTSAPNVGVVYGFTAMAGGLGSILFTQIVGILTDAQQSFRAAFLIAGTLPIAAACVLLLVPGRISRYDRRTPV